MQIIQLIDFRQIMSKQYTQAVLTLHLLMWDQKITPDADTLHEKIERLVKEKEDIK